MPVTKCILTVVFLFLSVVTRAQYRSNIHYTTFDGLPSQAVYAILQDSSQKFNELVKSAAVTHGRLQRISIPTHETFLRLFKTDGKIDKASNIVLKDADYGNKESYYGEKYLCREETDGKQKQSVQLTAKISTGSRAISIIPNPNQGNFKVSLGRFDGMVRTIKIIDGNGKIVSTINVNTKLPVAGYEVSVKGIASGIYLVEVVTETNKLTSKVLIQK